MHTTITVAFLFCLFIVTKLYERGRRVQRELPARGFSSIWSSYVSSIFNSFNAKVAVHEACTKFCGDLHTFALVGQWVVLAKSKNHVRDFCNAPEEVLSMEAAAQELLQLHNIVGEQFCSETYHIPAIRTSLNQNLSSILPRLLDEMVLSYAQNIDSCFRQHDGDGWTAIKAMDVLSHIICQCTSRVFVGPSLCRNEEYCRLAIGFTRDVLTFGPIVKFLVPRSLRSFCGWIFQLVYGHHRRMLKLLTPAIERRQLGESSLETNDMLTWLANSESSSSGHSMESIAMRMLNVNFVALHTTTKTFTHAVYHLASKLMYLPLLRAEVEEHLGYDTSTWTKEAISRCAKLDSFFKETLRLNGLGAIWMPRFTLSTFVFSDDTEIPAGHFVATAATAVHEDEKNYEQATNFDGLRFYKLREERGFDAHLDESEVDTNQDWQHRLTGTSHSYLAFGGGRHLCPGRFFAALEMKCLMAYLVLHYDVKMPCEGVRPSDEWFGPTSNPARDAIVLFRKRRL